MEYVYNYSLSLYCLSVDVHGSELQAVLINRYFLYYLT